MEKSTKTIIFLLLALFIGNIASAQNLTTVYGNLGVKDVNIQILNTQYGTSSDKNGDYKINIHRDTLDVVLLYTCVGYEDAVVVLEPEKLQSDSLEISFKMKHKNQMLDDVEITATKVKQYRAPKYVIMDFEISNDRFFILQRPENSYKKFRILVTNNLFDALDTISVPEGIIPESLLLDCAKQCQMMTADTVYQIVEDKGEYFFAYPTDRNHFMNIMRDCLFITDNYIYIKQVDKTGYHEFYYRVNLNDRKAETIFNNIDYKSQQAFTDEYSFHIEYMQYVKSLGLPYRGPGAEEWGLFLKNVWFHPKSSYLGFSNDTLFYLNHANSVIETYDEELNLLHSCDITYPTKEDFWRYIIYQDRVFGKFYTIFGETLNEIDVKTGKTYPKTSVNQWTSQKIVIYKGTAYVLKRRMDSGNKWVSYIDRIQF